MISPKAAYQLGIYRAMYSSARLHEMEYWGHRKDERDFGIALAIIPHVLNTTETRMDIRVYNPMQRGFSSYAPLDTVHPDDVQAYVEAVDAFLNSSYGQETVVRLMSEADLIPS